jgi:hypothetical protein
LEIPHTTRDSHFYSPFVIQRLERLAPGVHAFDLLADTDHLLLNFEDFAHLSGARAKDVLETLLGLSRILQARDEVHTLLREFLGKGRLRATGAL